MIKKHQTIATLFFAALIYACAEPAAENQTTEAEADVQTEAVETTDDSYEMPSESSFKLDLIIANNIAAPVKLLTDMNKAGLDHYREDVTNPTDKLSSYATANDKAIAFGVYGADLSYKSLYNRNQEMADYLIAIRKLSEDLGLTHLFDQESMEQFESIKDNPDSVKMFIFERYDNADEYLRSNDRMLTATMIITGGLIESLHLVSAQIESGDANKEAYTIFLEQRHTLKNLLDLYESLEKDGQEISVKGDVQKLYDKFVEVDSFEKFSKENIKALQKVILEVRNSLV